MAYEALEYDTGDGIVYSLRRLQNLETKEFFPPYLVFSKLNSGIWGDVDTWDNEEFLFNMLLPYLRGEDDINDPHGTLQNIDKEIPNEHVEGVVDMLELAELKEWYAVDSSRK